MSFHSFSFLVPGMEPRASQVPGWCCTIKPHASVLFLQWKLPSLCPSCPWPDVKMSVLSLERLGFSWGRKKAPCPEEEEWQAN